VTAHRINLGDQGNRQFRMFLGDCYGSSQASTASPDDYDVCFDSVHT